MLNSTLKKQAGPSRSPQFFPPSLLPLATTKSTSLLTRSLLEKLMIMDKSLERFKVVEIWDMLFSVTVFSRLVVLLDCEPCVLATDFTSVSPSQRTVTVSILLEDLSPRKVTDLKIVCNFFSCLQPRNPRAWSCSKISTSSPFHLSSFFLPHNRQSCRLLRALPSLRLRSPSST